MYVELYGDSWASWIREAVGKGCDIYELKSKMVEACWTETEAINALNEARGLDVLNTRRPEIPKHTFIDVDGQLIKVMARMDSPSAALLENLLTPDEVEELISLAKTKGLTRSGVIDHTTGTNVEHEARTSSGVYFTYNENPLLTTITDRIAKLTGWPPENAEALQVLMYGPGEQYKPHFDWFDKNSPGTASHLSRGGQRVGTTVIYLQVSDDGGTTRFPKSSVEFVPNPGGAVFFADIDAVGEPDQATLHSGTPVIEGVKIVATYWQRELPMTGYTIEPSEIKE